MARLQLDRRQFLLATGGTAAGFALDACSGTKGTLASATAQGPIKRGGVLTLGQDVNPVGLDPQKDAAFSTLNVIEQMYSSLLRWDYTQTKILPDLAIKWSQPNPTTFTFTLRPNVKFANGTPLTSADVKYTFERIADPATTSPWKSIFQVISEITTPDPLTATFHLAKPFAPLLRYLATPWYSSIVSRADVESRNGSLSAGGYGTGPFVLESYVPDSLVRLRRNPYYHRPGLPYLDGIVMQIIPSDTTRLSALREGTLNMTWVVNPTEAESMHQVPGLVVPTPTHFSFEEGIELDQTKPPFDDVRVRRALSLCLDRNEIIDIVLKGVGSLSTKIPPAEQPFGDTAQECAALPYYKQDLQMAKRLLAEAGHPNGFTTTMEVSPLYFQDVPTAEVIKQQAAQAGITINLKEAAWSTELNDYLATANPLSMIGLVWQPDPDADCYDIYSSKSAINLGKWKDPQVDALLEAGRTTYDLSERTSIYKEIQHRVADQVYMIYAYGRPGYWEMWQSNVHGYEPTPGANRIALEQTWMS